MTKVMGPTVRLFFRKARSKWPAERHLGQAEAQSGADAQSFSTSSVTVRVVSLSGVIGTIGTYEARVTQLYLY